MLTGYDHRRVESELVATEISYNCEHSNLTQDKGGVVPRSLGSSLHLKSLIVAIGICLLSNLTTKED